NPGNVTPSISSGADCANATSIAAGRCEASRAARITHRHAAGGDFTPKPFRAAHLPFFRDFPSLSTMSINEVLPLHREDIHEHFEWSTHRTGLDEGLKA
ncbi:MAG: hypothetical protein AAGK78_04975, partial [Planctomycetota bacterium]